MTVSLEFRAEGQSWRVTRATSKSGSPPTVHHLECLSDPGFIRLESESEVTAEIKRLVGLDYTAFKSAVLLPQGRFQTLLQAPEGQRSSILKGVFGLHKIGKIRERTKDIAEEKRSKVDELRDKQTTLAPDPERELEECTQLKDGYEQREVMLREYVRVCGEIEESKREIKRILEDKKIQLKRLRGDVAVVDELDDLSELLQIEQELNQRRIKLEGQREYLEAEREQCTRLLIAHREAGEDESSLEVASQALENLAEEYPTIEDGLKSNVRRRQEIEEKEEELKKREASRKKAAAEARKARESHEAMRERYLNALGAAQGLDLMEARERDQEQRRRVETATSELEHVEKIRTEAREHQDTLRDEHAALHLAMKLAPGSSCPVCAQTVPQDFKAPIDGLSDKELSEAATATEEAERSYQEASGEFTEAREALRLARERLAEERKKLSGIGEVLRETLGLELSDEHLEENSGDLRSLFKPLEERMENLGEQRAKAEQDERNLSLSAENLRADIEGSDAGLRRDEERLGRDLNKLESRRENLPEGFRPTSLDEDFDPLQSRLRQRLKEVRELKENESEAQGGLEEVRRNLEALRERREAEVLRPRRRTREATISLARDLEDAEIEIETCPDEDAPLEEHIQYVDDLLSHARKLVGELEERVTETNKRLEAEDERLGHVLEDASVADVDELQRMHEEARGQLTALRQKAEAAEERLPEWKRVLEDLDETRTEQSTYEELARLLTDAKFVKYVVHRRQRALLGLASEIFKGMTNGRYGFSEDFEVVVTESEQPRPSMTLSGGETFLASLSLALGLMELAGRSGGRLDSFFLDEGFGSLDAVTLDLALAELGRRASRGRLVALISHVPAVAENIDDVLRVRRTPDGNSEASWQEPSGEQEVDAELVKAALTAHGRE
jgi:DNA repair protein SbcC/Rad50